MAAEELQNVERLECRNVGLSGGSFDCGLSTDERQTLNITVRQVDIEDTPIRDQSIHENGEVKVEFDEPQDCEIADYRAGAYTVLCNPDV